MMNKKYKILLVEDELIQRRAIELMLKNTDFEVVTVENGLIAMEHVSGRLGKVPDIILSDINMPGMDGYELTVKAKEIAPEIFVLMLTATAARSAIQTAFDVGATDFLRKPVDSLELIARIKNLIRLKEAEASLKNAMKELEGKNKILEELSVTDELTGVYNRRFFFSKIEENIYNSDRYDLPLSIFMFDVDSFKAINDNYGHQAGDHILHNIGKILKTHVRKTDIPCRFGGDEFVIVFNNSDIDNARKAAELIRNNIKTILIGETGRKITISGGLRQHSPKETIEELVAAADALLYKAKDVGRDRIES